jgi:hypothetical protein
MLDALHELTVTELPFNTTRLLPCAVPKFAPVITTWLPTEPVVADTLVITGAGVVVVLTDTLSIVAVAKLVFESLLTPSPMYTFVVIEMV